ncbi:uncharacterized protein [Pyxicephalus adspersus]|uniref:uncharacterized protein n=1 Tax=Pyxicephalus adspersus TaxID=30357 RepID=UPI003B5B649D
MMIMCGFFPRDSPPHVITYFLLLLFSSEEEETGSSQSLAVKMNGLWFHVVALQSLLLAVLGECPNTQYPHYVSGRDICCNNCGAGEEIKKVCTSHNTASMCEKCPAGYYNPANYRGNCRPCKICIAAEGSIEVKPCTISSDAVCRCPEGSRPKNERNTACLCEPGKEIVNKKCQPCVYGHFSSYENSQCQPWTNCSALGLAVLVDGSATNDVQCSKPKSTIAWLLATSVTPTSPHRRKILENTETSTVQISITSTKHSTPYKVMNWDTVTLILITVTLLMVLAGIIMAMIIQTKKRKRGRRFIRSNRCKTPVQEESTSSDSSLTKHSPV